MFSSDMLPALHDLVKVVEGISVPTCAAADATTHCCTKAGTTSDGITVLANATDALVDPARAWPAGLKDRQGNVTSLRNDGTTNPQVTPLYLVLETLNEIDAAFAAYAQANPKDNGRQAQWQLARSQLVDQFLARQRAEHADGGASPNPSHPEHHAGHRRRGALAARRELSHVVPAAVRACAWARDVLDAEASRPFDGPMFAVPMDLDDAIRQNGGARQQLELQLTYLMGIASTTTRSTASSPPRRTSPRSSATTPTWCRYSG